PAAPQQSDDLECLPQHLLPGVDRVGKARADDVLVESFTGSHSEGEPVVGHERERCGGLGNNRRMVTHGRAGHAGRQLDPLGADGDGAEQAPGERGVSLIIQPRVVVIAHLHEVETRLFGADGLAHDLLWPESLRSQFVTDPHRTPRFITTWSRVEYPMLPPTTPRLRVRTSGGD